MSRKKARKLHEKMRDSNGSDRFPELPRCISCTKPAKHLIPPAADLEETDPDVLLGAGLAFLQDMPADDPLDKIERQMYFRRILNSHGLSENHGPSEREVSLAKVWCRRVRKKKHAPWEVFQAVLRDDRSKLPAWARDPAGPEHRQRSDTPREQERRLLHVLNAFEVIDVLSAVVGLAKGDALQFFEQQRITHVTGGKAKSADQAPTLAALFAELAEVGYKNWVVRRAVYRRYLAWSGAKPPAEFPKWAAQPPDEDVHDKRPDLDVPSSKAKAGHAFAELVVQFRGVAETCVKYRQLRSQGPPEEWTAPPVPDDEHDPDDADSSDGDVSIEPAPASEAGADERRAVEELDKDWRAADRRSAYEEFIGGHLQPAEHEFDVLTTRIKQFIDKHQWLRHGPVYGESLPAEISNLLPEELKPCKKRRGQGQRKERRGKRQRQLETGDEHADQPGAEHEGSRPEKVAREDVDMDAVIDELGEKIAGLSQDALDRLKVALRDGGVEVGSDGEMEMTIENIDFVKDTVESLWRGQTDRSPAAYSSPSPSSSSAPAFPIDPSVAAAIGLEPRLAQDTPMSPAVQAAEGVDDGQSAPGDGPVASSMQVLPANVAGDTDVFAAVAVTHERDLAFPEPEAQGKPTTPTILETESDAESDATVPAEIPLATPHVAAGADGDAHVMAEIASFAGMELCAGELDALSALDLGAQDDSKQ